MEYVTPQSQRAYRWREEGHWTPRAADIKNVSDHIYEAGNAVSVAPHFMESTVSRNANTRPTDDHKIHRSRRSATHDAG